MAKRGKAIGETERLLIGTAVLSIGAYWFYTRFLGIPLRLPFMGYGQLGYGQLGQLGYQPMRIQTHDGRTRRRTQAELACLNQRAPWTS
jgi:hypothetical protein